MTFVRTLPVLALALVVSACDSAEGPDASVARVSIDLLAVSTTGNCDSSTNPADYQFEVEALDEGNRLLTALDLPSGSTYGTYAAEDLISLFAGDEVAVNQTLSFERPREDGGGFALQFSAMEWDSATARDGDMDDRSSIASHVFRNGSFNGVIGERSVQVWGSPDCNARLTYNVTVQ